MSRYILRFKGTGPKPAADVERIAAKTDVNIVDEGTSRMLLVDAAPAGLADILAELPDWAASPEEMIELPDPRYEISASAPGPASEDPTTISTEDPPEGPTQAKVGAGTERTLDPGGVRPTSPPDHGRSRGTD